MDAREARVRLEISWIPTTAQRNRETAPAWKAIYNMRFWAEAAPARETASVRALVERQ